MATTISDGLFAGAANPMPDVSSADPIQTWT